MATHICVMCYRINFFAEKQEQVKVDNESLKARTRASFQLWVGGNQPI
jgi:hypothetical protein